MSSIHAANLLTVRGTSSTTSSMLLHYLVKFATAKMHMNTNLVFGRPLVKQFALCYRTVVCLVCLTVCPVLSCSVCLSDCNVGVLWPNDRMDQDETWHGGSCLGPGHILLRGDPAPTPQKGHSPIFGPSLLSPNGWMN